MRADEVSMTLEQAELMVRSLVADKEFITAQADRDLRICGKWCCDYETQYNVIQEQLRTLMRLITK